MEELSGKISDRIRKGKIDKNAVFPAKRPGTEPPTPEAILNAKGQGLGDGPTRRRSGPGAKTHED